MNIKKLLLLSVIVILIIAIPISVISLRQQQTTRTHASAATSLSFSNVPTSVKPGDKFSVNIQLDPGINQVSFVALAITYDKTLIQTDTGFTVNQSAFPSIVEQPTYADKTNTCTGNLCTMTITLNIGGDVTKVVTQPTTVASLGLHAVGPGQAMLSFKIPPTNVQALDSNSSIQKNVLSTATSANILISGASTITPILTATPTATIIPITPTIAAIDPTCDSLTADISTQTVPTTVSFTLTGHAATTATIQKATVDFGDGKAQTIPATTNSVSLTASHVYQTAATYTTIAQLFDSVGAVSKPCVQSFTIAPSTATTSAPLTRAPLPATGPADSLLQLGAMGFIFMLGGTALLMFL